MFQTIGSFIDNFLFLAGGIFLLTQQKKINKTYIKWIAILLIIIGILLTVMDIIDLKK